MNSEACVFWNGKRTNRCSVQILSASQFTMSDCIQSAFKQQATSRNCQEITQQSLFIFLTCGKLTSSIFVGLVTQNSATKATSGSRRLKCLSIKYDRDTF